MTTPLTAAIAKKRPAPLTHRPTAEVKHNERLAAFKERVKVSKLKPKPKPKR